MLKILCTCVVFLLCFASFAEKTENPFEIQRGKGIVTIEHKTSIFLRWLGQKGKSISQKAKAFEVNASLHKNSMQGKGVWRLPGGNANVQTAAEFNGAKGIVSYSVCAEKPIDTMALQLQFNLPISAFAGQSIIIDGSKLFEFPDQFTVYNLKQFKDVNEFQLPLSSGSVKFKLSKPCNISICDNRKNKANHYWLNIDLLPPKTPLTKLSFKIQTEYQPYRTTPITLNEAANSTFSDKNPDDRKGGWTDQGANQDLHDFPVGKKLKAGFAEFSILSAKDNNGKECIVLGGGGRYYLPEKAEQNFASPITMKTLVLLHGSAWTRGDVIGNIDLLFADGTTHKIPVTGNKDVGNWWNPQRIANGFIGYTRRNDESETGLYLSVFPVSEKPVCKITFSSTGKSVWMIAAASASPDFIKLSAPQNYLFKRNSSWREIKLDHRTEPGSALDFSFMREAPAGKYGHVIVKDGKFVFEKAPDKRIRFYGTNLCTLACTLPKEQTEQVVEWLSGTGYNTIRLHQFDRELVDRKLPKNSLAFQETQIDNMDYLIHLLKERGFYIMLDLFALRDRKPGEFKSAPELRELKDMKLGIMVNPEIRENFKTFIRKFLGHKNKYTGQTLAEDPVLAGICIINENMIVSLYDDCKLFGKNGGESFRFCNEELKKYCTENNLELNNSNFRVRMIEFLYMRYREYFKEMKALLRDELHVKAPLTDQNHRQPPLATELRNEYDFVDNHIYWDHPGYIGKIKWVPPYQIRNKSLLEGGLWPFRMLSPSRIIGKPFTVTEFNVCYPNQYRADSGILFGAFAAFQDWDGLYRFDYAHPNAMFGKPYQGTFATLNDPVRILSDKLGILLFVREDLKPAPQILPLVIPSGRYSETYVESFPLGMQQLFSHVRTGSMVKGNPLPQNTMTPWILGEKTPPSVDKAMKIKPSEIILDAKRNLTAVVTPRLEAVALPEKQSFKGKRMSVKSHDGFYSVIAAASLDKDKRDLKNSRRVLLFFLTDIRQEGMLFASEEGSVVLKEPLKTSSLLVRRGKADVTLELAAGKWSVTALDDSGKTLGSVPLVSKNGKYHLKIDNFQFPGKIIFAYDIKQQ